MNIPTYRQGDPSWGNDTLGYNEPGSEFNMANYGCLVTAAAMMIQGFRNNDQHAFYISPQDLNNYLTDHQGYVPGTGNLIWGALNNVPGNDLIFQGSYEYPGQADLSFINSCADKGWLGLCEVRWGGVENRTHFVLLAGRHGDWDYDLFDPWVGDTTHFNSGRFGSGSAARDIYSIHFYSDATPDQPVISAPPIEAPKIPDVVVETPATPKIETPTPTIPEPSSIPLEGSVRLDTPRLPTKDTSTTSNEKGVNFMTKLLEFLAGKKTYLSAFVFAVIVFLKAAGFIDEGTATFLQGLAGAAGLASLRAAVK